MLRPHRKVRVHGGKLRIGKDEGREGASRVGEAPVSRCRTSAFDGRTKAGEVVFSRHQRDVASKGATADTALLWAAVPSGGSMPDQPTRYTGSPIVSMNAMTSCIRRCTEWSGLSPDRPRPRVLGV